MNACVSAPFKLDYSIDSVITNGNNTSIATLQTGWARTQAAIWFTPTDNYSQSSSGSVPTSAVFGTTAILQVNPQHPLSWNVIDKMFTSITGAGLATAAASAKFQFSGGFNTSIVHNSALTTARLKIYTLVARNDLYTTVTTSATADYGFNDPYWLLRRGISDNGTAGGTTQFGYRHLDTTPFLSPLLVERWKVTKCTTKFLEPGKNLKLTLRTGSRTIQADKYYSTTVSESGSAVNTQVLEYAKGTRIHFIQLSYPLCTSTDNSSPAQLLQALFATGTVTMQSRTYVAGHALINTGISYQGFIASNNATGSSPANLDDPNMNQNDIIQA